MRVSRERQTPSLSVARVNFKVFLEHTLRIYIPRDRNLNNPNLKTVQYKYDFGGLFGQQAGGYTIRGKSTDRLESGFKWHDAMLK